jgi:hypothetical protein
MRRVTVVIMPLLTFLAIALPSSIAAASWPTTVDFQAVGPEARITSFGVQHPRRFEYGPISMSYDVTAWQVSWKHWSASTTLGRGHVRVLRDHVSLLRRAAHDPPVSPPVCQLPQWQEPLRLHARAT